jgi:dCMP deaminase
MNVLDMKWTSRFMDIARQVAGWSKDPHTGVGAVVVSEGGTILSTGFNGLPRGVRDHAERMTRDQGEKYLWMAHAEENAITNAAREGVRLTGSTMFVTHQPCARCAGMIVNAGISCVVVAGGASTISDREIGVAAQKFLEGQVKIWAS